MQPFRKIAFYTLGCKLNFSETSAIARDFIEHGYARVEMDENPDVLVINTCSVTDNADKKCQRLVRQAKRNSPAVFVAVIGCYAQLKPEDIAAIDGVDIVLGANEKFNLPQHIEQLEKREETIVLAGEIKEVRDFVPSYSLGDRTRSFLKVQDGCDYFCSFCTIPLARGRSRSASVEETLREVRKVAKTDIREVVLTGVNIGDFGKGSKETFLDLIKKLDEVEGIDRYRISSIEPNLLNNEIIQFVASSKKFVPHFHIPLQSGSDKLLESMRRKYRKELYADRVQQIKKRMPDACIGVDVIVGYPGEGKEEFIETYNFLNELDVSYLHVFTYSERDNTTAVRMGDSVDAKERAERSKMLRILSIKKRRYFYESMLGKSFDVLFEAKEEEGKMNGFTQNYIKIETSYDQSLINQIRKVKLSKLGDEVVEIEPIAEMVSI